MIVQLMLAVLFVSLPALAQPWSELPRVGYLQTYPSLNDPYFAAFRKQLGGLSHDETCSL